jgi:hypothetical protein
MVSCCAPNPLATIAFRAASNYYLRGVLGLFIEPRTARRLLAIFLAAAVVCFAFQAAEHWHNNPYEGHHCRVCHFAHAATIDFSNSAALLAPIAVTRFAPATAVDPTLDLIFHQISSRAPPALSL